MPGTPGNGRVPITGSALCETVDTFDGQQALGTGRRYTLTERIQILVPGPGIVNSGVLPPVGVRLVIVGVSVDWPPLGAGVSFAFQATTAGSGLMGTSDTPLGNYASVTADFWTPLGSPEGTLPSLSGAHLNVVTSEGDGVTPVYRIAVAALTPPDQVNVTVHYTPIYGTNPVC